MEALRILPYVVVHYGTGLRYLIGLEHYIYISPTQTVLNY